MIGIRKDRTSQLRNENAGINALQSSCKFSGVLRLLIFLESFFQNLSVCQQFRFFASAESFWLRFQDIRRVFSDVQFRGQHRNLWNLEYLFVLGIHYSSSSNDILHSFSLASQLFIVTTATPNSFETEVTLRFDSGRIFFNPEFLKLVVYFILPPH